MTKNLNLEWSYTIADILSELGARYVCICPGQRNSPLTIAFTDNKNYIASSHIDERSAGFFGLGISKGNNIPTIVITTSGTATFKFQLENEPAIQTYGYGWGTNTWNTEAWGTARSVSSVTLDAGIWHFDNAGEDLYAWLKNGGLYSKTGAILDIFLHFFLFSYFCDGRIKLLMQHAHMCYTGISY